MKALNAKPSAHVWLGKWWYHDKCTWFWIATILVLSINDALLHTLLSHKLPSLRHGPPTQIQNRATVHLHVPAWKVAHGVYRIVVRSFQSRVWVALAVRVEWLEEHSHHCGQGLWYQSTSVEAGQKAKELGAWLERILTDSNYYNRVVQNANILDQQQDHVLKAGHPGPCLSCVWFCNCLVFVLV